MRNFLENTKTIAVELVGVIGGFIWSYKSNWDYEPIILLFTSFTSFTISMWLILKDRKVTTVENTVSKADDSLESQPNHTAIYYELPHVSQPIFYTEIEPISIRNSIKNTPPFQQNEVANNFIGLNVKWHLKLSMIGIRPNNMIHVFLKPISNEYMNVTFYTNVNEYPFLKIAEEGKEFIVSGKIIDCKLFDVELELISIE